jgi:hypothetical protein
MVLFECCGSDFGWTFPDPGFVSVLSAVGWVAPGLMVMWGVVCVVAALVVVYLVVVLKARLSGPLHEPPTLSELHPWARGDTQGVRWTWRPWWTLSIDDGALWVSRFGDRRRIDADALMRI